MKKFFTLIIISIPVLSFSQSTSTRLEIPKSATITVSEINEDWFPTLQREEMPLPGLGENKSYIEGLKEQIKTHSYSPSAKTVDMDSTIKPIVLSGYAANPYNGSVPSDNDMAISNAGKVVSGINSTVSFSDATEDTPVITTVSLQAFGDTLGLNSGKYDPKVLYDPKQDKFILVYLSGFTSTTSDIIVAFSQTNDPYGAWNLYSLPGDVYGDTTWTDYPIIAMTDSELFISVNALLNNSSWQTGFRKSMIWQVNKNDGYTADSLSTRVWTNTSFSGKPIRNLCPIQGASTTVGPNIYFLSNRNFAIETDTFFILEITGELDDVNTQLNIEMRQSDLNYGMPPNGKQYSIIELQTNDARVLDGFIENNTIHFAGNTVNPVDTSAAVYHGVVSNVSTTKDFTGNLISDDYLDFGYPNLSYTGKYDGDDQWIISFDYTGDTVNAGFAAVFRNRNGEYSTMQILRTGDGYINVLSGPYERWGDYSGSQRKYDEPGKVWVFGTYGLANHNYGNWVAGMMSPDSLPPVSVQPMPEIKTAVTVYPNPSADVVTVEFEVEDFEQTEIAVYDLSGKKVKTLLTDTLRRGKYKFSFSTLPLASGIYFLTVMINNQIGQSEKLEILR